MKHNEKEGKKNISDEEFFSLLKNFNIKVDVKLDVIASLKLTNSQYLFFTGWLFAMCSVGAMPPGYKPVPFMDDSGVKITYR